jgi:hypothetical protein
MEKNVIPNEVVGIAGLTLTQDKYDLGNGVVLKKDYAHIVMTPRITFTPSEGKAHRGPWRALKTWLFSMPAGSRVTILASISAPAFVLTPGTKPDHPSFWIVHLLSLQANANLAIAYYFDEVTEGARDEQPVIKMWMDEFLPLRTTKIEDHQIEWVRDNWLASINLIEDPSFSFATQVLFHDHTVRNRELQLVSVWAALERIFSSKGPELRFRVSAQIAAYLQPNGTTRRELFSSVLVLYDERSRAAHGSPLKTDDAYERSIELLRRTLIKMIEQRSVPTSDELEKLLFG